MDEVNTAEEDDGFGQRLLLALTRADMSQADLARELGVKHRSQVHAWTTGTIPRDDTLAEIAAVLGVTEAWLRYGVQSDDEQQPDPPSGSGSISETDRRIQQILSDRGISPANKSELIIDLALALRADALREREVRARIEAEAYRTDAQNAMERRRQLALDRRREEAMRKFREAEEKADLKAAESDQKARDRGGRPQVAGGGE